MNDAKPLIGYTTGVFDLFHVGHLNLLKAAKEYCDYLIVGITTDELSVEFKGKKPIIPYEDRFEIVSAIKFVDKVVMQNSMSKYDAWKEYQFDIMFASDNPTVKWPKVEKEFLDNFKNCKAPKIIRLPYTMNISSTILRNKFEEKL